MRTAKEVQKWFNKNPVLTDEYGPIHRWIESVGEYKEKFHIIASPLGKNMFDVVDFVNSPSPTKEKDLNPLVVQFEKIEKEILKMRKLINKL